MEAVMLSIHVQHFLPKLVGKNVLIRLDNSTVVRYINKLSSVVHENLETMAIGIRQSDVTESSTHGREKNILADRLSRFKVQPTEWTLNKKIVLKLFTIWEVPHIDLFASHQTQIYYTPTHREGAILQSRCLSVRPFVRPFTLS